MPAPIGLSKKFFKICITAGAPAVQMERNVMFWPRESGQAQSTSTLRVILRLFPPFPFLDVDETLVGSEACFLLSVFILLRLELLRYGSYLNCNHRCQWS